MANIWTTGPAHMFVGTGSLESKGINYLGTAETAPQIDIRSEYDTVMNDMFGSRLPADRLYEGSEAMISATLTRWSEITIAKLMSVPDYSSAAIRGTNTQSDIGTLMGTEGFTFPLWVWFPYSPSGGQVTGKSAFEGMPPGYRFWSCIFMPDTIIPGTGAKRHSVSFLAQRSFTSASDPFQQYSNVGNSGGSSAVQSAAFVLYDNNMDGIDLSKIN